MPPLHTAPIFMHRGINNTKATAYEVPHWINLSFVDPERAADALAWVAAAAPRRARDGWRMARLDLLTTEPEEEELKPVVDQEQQVRLRALAQRRRRVPDLLAHLVGAELDTSQPPLQRPRRFIQQKSLLEIGKSPSPLALRGTWPNPWATPRTRTLLHWHLLLERPGGPGSTSARRLTVEYLCLGGTSLHQTRHLTRLIDGRRRC